MIHFACPSCKKAFRSADGKGRRKYSYPRCGQWLQVPAALALTRNQTILGVEQHAAETVIAEIGPNMEQFPTVNHLASWAGMYPGNNDSAGKRKSGKTTKECRWPRQILTQAAWAASHTKDAYLLAQYRRLAARRGKQRSLVALGHTLPVIMYNLLRNRTIYQDLGGGFLERLEPDRLTRRLVQRLEKLGHDVTLRPKEDAA